MKRETINILLTIIAIIPFTFFMFISVYGIINILSRFDIKDSLLLSSMLFGIFGYVGLLMNLKQNKEIKNELLNFVFLSLGIIGFVMFNSFEGGTKAWKWIFTIEEPDEWLIFVGPILITTLITIMKGKRLTTMYKNNKG
jgi:hypothetical protein